MRKDVKLAFVVGGILISVLVVYVLVVPGGQKRPDKQAVTLEGAPEAAGANNPSSADKSAPGKSTADNASADKSAVASDKSADNAKSAEVTPDTKLAEGPATRPTDPFAGASSKDSADLWMSALNRGSVPMMTSAPPTPAPQLPKSAIARSQATGSTATPVSPVSVESGPSTRPVAAEAASVHGDMRTHVVARGETIAKIAEAAYGSQNYWPYIIRANPGIVAEKIRPGMTINLPPESEVKTSAPSNTTAADATAPKADTTSPKIDTQTQYEVQTGDSLHKIAMKLYGSSAKWQAIYDLNKEAIGPDPAKVKVKSVLKLPEPPTQK